jgi:hypothetical protein
MPARNTQPRYNICPTTNIDVVIERDGKRELSSMRWGLIPSWWSKPLKEMRVATFNARAETVANKPVFSDAFKRMRCLIPASGYLAALAAIALADCALRPRQHPSVASRNSAGCRSSGRKSMIKTIMPIVIGATLALLALMPAAEARKAGSDPIQFLKTAPDKAQATKPVHKTSPLRGRMTK